jgi:hypothetical protein
MDQLVEMAFPLTFDGLEVSRPVDPEEQVLEAEGPA